MSWKTQASDRVEESPRRAVRAVPEGLARLAAAALASLAFTAAGATGVDVRTLGGGRLTAGGPDYGFVDGSTLDQSQFHSPAGIAVDASGVVYLADRDNGAIRRLDVANDRSSTLLTGLNQPVAVAVAGPNDIYFVTQGDGRLGRMDRFGNVQFIVSGLASPSALAVDAATNIYITELRGTVARVAVGTATVSVVANGFNQPSGIAVLDNGLLAVSDTGNHQIRTLHPSDGRVLLTVGDGQAGFRNGDSAHARFNQPQQLVKTPAGQIVVADRLNHRVRLVDSDGTVSTVYGVDSTLWEGPECSTCSPMILPGWYDASSDFAEARDPVGLALNNAGTLYVTEAHYHVVRAVTGAFATGTGTSGPKIDVLPPILSPASGFHPMGQTITVVNPNSNPFLPTAVYYTTDGSEPGTNSLKLQLTGNTGTIYWHSPDRDLRSLRLKAFIGADSSATVGGAASSASEIGIPRDISAGMGSTAVLPVIVNLRTNDALKSLQFRVEVAPASPNAPVIPETFHAMSITTNDFFRVATSDKSPSAGGTNQTAFSTASYLLGDTRGLVITMIGTNANLSVKDFAVVGMVAVPIPPSAKAGDRYRIEILRPSGTADGLQESVVLQPMAARTITVANVGYEVGNTAEGVWYNADAPGARGFGNAVLDNADVNNAFHASLGVRVPPPFSDLYDAMDAFPEDAEGVAGGDGLIRFLDWQIVLLRSLGLDSSRWERTWSDGGIRVAHRLNVSGNGGLRSTPASSATVPPPGNIWYRQALLKAETLERAIPGTSVDVPIHIVVAPGEKLGGLAFRASVSGEGFALPLSEPVQFVSAPGIPPAIQSQGQSLHDVLCAWSLVPAPEFNPPLQGDLLLGWLRMTVPVNASPGHVYTVRFSNADAAPDLKTQYDIETLPGSVWVQSGALRPAETISAEWKTRFFGSEDSADAQPGADPDGDGIPNLLEYRAGTNPVERSSFLHLQPPAFDSSINGIVLRWLSSKGRFYTLEASEVLAGGLWTPVATGLAGTGYTQEFAIQDGGENNRFYRLRLHTP